MTERIRNIYGIDLASKNDYFAVVLHQLPEYIQGVDYLPKIKTLRKYPHMDYSEMLKVLEMDLFRRFPPFYIVPDYTNEKTFTDLLIKDYGKDIVEPVVFTQSSKYQLKQDGLSIMKQGYLFPNPAQIKNPTIAAWMRGLIDELLREQIVTTKSNSISFDHPPGEHNDLAIAWELSIHGCQRHSLRPVSHPVVYASNGKVDKNLYYSDPTEFVKELKKNPNVHLGSVSVKNPSEVI